MEIVTKRFLLRDFVEDDLSALIKTWAGEHPRRNYQLAITQRNESQLLVGCCGLRSAGSEAGKAELGIELAPQCWGRYGYAIEVMRALVEFGFGSLELKEIYGGTVSVNSRIARLASSFGTKAVTRPARENIRHSREYATTAPARISSFGESAGRSSSRFMSPRSSTGANSSWAAF